MGNGRYTVMRKNAFTLLEVMIVIIIVGILASLAIPQFQRAVYRSRFAEVYTMMGVIARAKAAWYLENDSYGKVPDYAWGEGLAGNSYNPSAQEVQVDLGVEIPTNCFFQYHIGPTTGVLSSSIHFREPGDNWAWFYRYDINRWFVAGGATSRARQWFSPP